MDFFARFFAFVDHLTIMERCVLLALAIEIAFVVGLTLPSPGEKKVKKTYCLFVVPATLVIAAIFTFSPMSIIMRITTDPKVVMTVTISIYLLCHAGLILAVFGGAHLSQPNAHPENSPSANP